MNNLQAFWLIFGDVIIALWLGLTLLAASIGVWSLLLPNSFIQFNKRMSTWISIDKTAHQTKKSISIERPFYRYHLVTGTVLIIAAIFVLYEVIFNLNTKEIEQTLVTGSYVLDIWIGIFIDAAFGWIYISGFVALIIGSIVVIRPSYLKGIENRMNYWVETEKYGHTLDKKHHLLDEWVTKNPRIFGIISLIGSLVVAWSLFSFGYFA
jgi:hypothetical protein